MVLFLKSHSHKSLHHLPDVWMLTQDCYPLGTQPRFWPFNCYLVLPPLQSRYIVVRSHLLEYFHQKFKFPSVFSESLTTCCSVCFLSLLNISFQLPSCIFVFLLSLFYIFYRKYLLREIMKKYYNNLYQWKRRRCQTKSFLSTALWTHGQSSDVFTIKVTLQECCALS